MWQLALSVLGSWPWQHPSLIERIWITLFLGTVNRSSVSAKICLVSKSKWAILIYEAPRKKNLTWRKSEEWCPRLCNLPTIVWYWPSKSADGGHCSCNNSSRFGVCSRCVAKTFPWPRLCFNWTWSNCCGRTASFVYMGWDLIFGNWCSLFSASTAQSLLAVGVVLIYNFNTTTTPQNAVYFNGFPGLSISGADTINVSICFSLHLVCSKSRWLIEFPTKHQLLCLRTIVLKTC